MSMMSKLYPLNSAINEDNSSIKITGPHDTVVYKVCDLTY